MSDQLQLSDKHERAISRAVAAVRVAQKSDPWAGQRTDWLLRRPVVPCDLDRECANNNRGRNLQDSPYRVEKEALGLIARRQSEPNSAGAQAVDTAARFRAWWRIA